MSTDDKEKEDMWSKVEKYVGRATDEYTSRSELSLNIFSIPIIARLLIMPFVLRQAKYK